MCGEILSYKDFKQPHLYGSYGLSSESDIKMCPFLYLRSNAKGVLIDMLGSLHVVSAKKIQEDPKMPNISYPFHLLHER